MAALKLIYFDSSLTEMASTICQAYQINYIVSSNIVLVYTNETTKDIYERFDTVSNQRHFFVIELELSSKSYWGFMPESLWDWLKERLLERKKLRDIRLNIQFGFYKGLDSVPLYWNDTVKDILDRVYRKIDDVVKPYTYLSSWLMQNETTSNYLIINYENTDNIPATCIFKEGITWNVKKQGVSDDLIQTTGVRYH